MFKRRKKERTWKFYVVLAGILAGVYLLIVTVLAVRNPKIERTNTVTVSSASSVLQEAADPEHIYNALATPTPYPTDKPMPTKEPDDVKDTDRYGRDKERYTQMDTSDVISAVSIKVTNREKLTDLVGGAYDMIRSYINIYAAHEEIAATEIEMKDFIYTDELASRYEIRMEFNDEDKTQVIVIYEPANAAHCSFIDVVPQIEHN